MFMTLIPPWRHAYAPWGSLGYSLRFVPPEHAAIDMSRLFLQWLLVVIVVGTYVLTARRRDAAKFCPHCGRKRETSNVFCPGCGKKLGESG